MTLALPLRTPQQMTATDTQGLTIKSQILKDLGVASDRIYTDEALTRINRARLGLGQAMPAVRQGDRTTPYLDIRGDETNALTGYSVKISTRTPLRT